MAKANYRPGERLLAVLTLLKDYPDGLKPKDAIEKLAQTMKLNEYEKGHFEKNGERRFGYLIRFATIGAVKAGWIIKDGTRWIITEAGVEALNNFQTGEQIQKNVRKLYQQWKKDSGQPKDDDEISDDEEVSKSISVTYDQAEEQAQESIDAFLHQMKPFDFQGLVAELLTAMGYHVIWVSPPGKDGGTDILAYTDPLGIQGPRIKVQAKQQGKAVSEPELKSFVANIGPHDSGIYFCTGGFTQDARKYARQQENKRIMLVDSRRLVELWILNMTRLSDQAWQKLPLTPIYFLTPKN